MAKGTTFGSVHSYDNLNLIQQTVVIEPASTKTKYVDIPGSDGSKDLTESLGIGVKYNDRNITWTFALYPETDWFSKQKEVSGALNGLACHITLDDDPNYYYVGRVFVSEYASDRLLKQITIKATCRPYKLKTTETVVSRSDLSTSYKNLTLTNDRMPVVPIISVSNETTLSWSESTYTVAEGEHKILDIMLSKGTNTLKAKVSEGSGTISVTYREGAL